MYSLTANNELYSGMIKTSPLRKKVGKGKANVVLRDRLKAS